MTLLLFGKRLGDPSPGWLATAADRLVLRRPLVTFFDLLGQDEHRPPRHLELFTWVPVGGLDVDVALLVDPLSITMALFVTGVGTLIHLYSVGYMHGDARFPGSSST